MTTSEGTPPKAAWRGEMCVFSTAGEFERTLVQAAQEGAGVLCATGRLARRLLHRYRQARLATGERGWETPRIRSLRSWLRETYEELWPTRRGLSPTLALKLWHQAVQCVTAPEGLIAQPALYAQLQASLDILLETGLDALADYGAHPLAGFRREAAKHFLALAEREGAALWRDLVMAVSGTIANGRVALPARMILAGFDNISPLEGTLGDALAARSKTELWRAGAELVDQQTRIRLYATPEQECRAVCAEVLRAWNNGKRNLAVVFCDCASFPLLKRCFDDLAGMERPDFEHAIRYNLTIGTPLIEHQLFQTAIIPLRLPGEPLPARLLSSLLTSPYVRKPEPEALDNLCAALWAPQRTLPLREALKALADHGYSMAPFQQFYARQTAPLGDWLKNMNACLAAIGFGRFEGQHRGTDALAKQHLEEIIQELTKEAGEIVMSAAAALTWLTTLAEGLVVAEKTPETAGIQIMNPGEARGLAFDHLWVVGAHGAAIPPPAREWPFLAPDEQRLLEGGTLEWQWEQGQRQLAMLLAAAPQVNFSRAAAADEATPYPPCPLLPDETNSDNEPIRIAYNLWETPVAEWMRARWLREGCLALRDNEAVDTRHHSEPAATPLARELSVTALEDLAQCPFRYFCDYMLKLEPLVPAEAGIAPRVRGKVLHAILKTFVDGLADCAPGWPADEELARAWLEEAVNSELAHCPDNIFWRVERLRLLGNSAQPGILPVWLAAERERAQVGWRFVLAEAPFTKLPVAGLILHGRIDRIDHHPQEGLAVWDYKSGTVPTAASVIDQVCELQLPAYLLAVRHGRIPELKDIAAPMQAGYIGLKTVADVKVVYLGSQRNKIDWNEVLPQWEDALAQRVAAPSQGSFAAEPRPGSPAIFHNRKGACEFCEFFNLCGFFDRRPAEDNAQAGEESG
ncbi:MAG: PD-(D/E)XK nuclease family protein [Lentisphaerae bacterium]|nr:PD-(D/E)XK nuclease family protein [Lentisphaerota bacterium]